MENPVLGKSLWSDWFFLGQDFAVHTVSMETVQPVCFSFGTKSANLRLATKPAKKECKYCHSSHGNYQKKLKGLKFFRNFKDGWRRQTYLSASHRECEFALSKGSVSRLRIICEFNWLVLYSAPRGFSPSTVLRFSPLLQPTFDLNSFHFKCPQ